MESHTPVTLLLVDDYPDTLEMWTLYLRSLGYRVLTADNGLDAVAIATAELPNLVILDLDLPGISGYEVARRLRGAPATSAIPLIAATGYSDVRRAAEATHAGFGSVLVKPCEPAGLVRVIERMLAARPSSEQS